MSLTRRRFLAHSSAVAAAGALPARWVRAEDLPKDRKLKLRFAVASDLHFGPNKPKGKTEALLVWINREKKEHGLDALFINGDVTHDRASHNITLRDEYLTKLDVPYYCGKGNHDYVDQEPGSATESWEKIWGYPANHGFTLKDFAFVMADTSAPSDFRKWLAADPAWLKKELAKHRDAPAIFVLIHVAQRREGKDDWPKYGVHAKDQIEQAEAVMALIESTPNVKAVFHGHNHDEAGMWESGDKRYFFSGHAGGWWGLPRGYRIVEIDEDHRMVTYQVNAEEGGELNRNVIDREASKHAM